MGAYRNAHEWAYSQRELLQSLLPVYSYFVSFEKYTNVGRLAIFIKMACTMSLNSQLWFDKCVVEVVCLFVVVLCNSNRISVISW